MMKILLHTCCAPCLIGPFERLDKFDPALFYYNPNIRPFEEFQQRLQWVGHFAQHAKLDLITYEYKPDKYLEKVAFDKPDRCETCYRLRLMETARVAKMKQFEAFTSTLLASPHQKHELITEIGGQASKKFDVPFYYEDFRLYYREAYDKAKELGIYRQKYCGCIYSLKERQLQKAQKSRRPL